MKENRTAYGEPGGPSMVIFQLWMLPSSTRLTLMPAGGLVVTSASSLKLISKLLSFFKIKKPIPCQFSSALRSPCLCLWVLKLWWGICWQRGRPRDFVYSQFGCATEDEEVEAY